MNTPPKFTTLAAAVLLALTACGGGDVADDGPTALAEADTTADGARVGALAVSGSTAVGTLTLVSSSAAGKASASTTAPCGVSADGALVAFTSDASALVSGDTNQANDTFLKNTRTGALTRVSTGSDGAQMLGGASCLAMTPDGKSLVLNTPAGYGGPYGSPATEPGMFVKNLATGTLTSIAPPLNTFPTTAAYVFQSISDDGLRVAMIAAPTASYLGGYETVANGPARALIRDLGNGALINLSAEVQLDLSQGSVDGKLLLSPDGRKLAFNSRSNYAALGDTNGKSDVFVLDVASRALTLASSNSAGVQGSFFGPPLFNPSYGVIGFLNGGTQLAFVSPADSTLGAAGAYVKDLNSGASRLVFASGSFALPALSFSGDGTQVAFDRDIQNPNTQATPAVWVRNLLTGQERRVNTTATGVVGNNAARFAMISRDGSTVTFQSNATNLLRAARVSYIYEIFAKTVNATSGG